ncbi:YjjG family noncanonical pyrimidine nucleotidase [Sporosarcina limicola]|uniref:2-haloacid dehalogenase n=1 Tax=Sporosarcina limicola TaxID=34101 RepID=A0A927MPN3_9BACL|nr:YjjG family noncanonical pyrimidine nucleotidase [Sporosarcina limicola]MBE1556692.1 2-haloacid dehalogenase [Sporosarcina limicola]
MKYDVLLFDLDDTLLDFSLTEKHALSNTFQTFGLPNGFNEYITSYKAISKMLWDDLEQGRTTLAELKVERFKRLFLQHELTMDAEFFGHTYLENLGKEVHIIDGVEEMIAGLSDYRLALLTNGFNDVQHARMNRSIFSNSFEAIITSEEAGTQKPQVAIFDYTFEKLQISDKSRVLMIGDSLTSDIQGGTNYGIDTCWFNPQMKKNVTAIQPTYKIHAWADFISDVLL